jgi:hypothetical protein
MSAMHAAMDKLGVGMPCGLIARFENTRTAQITEAILASAGRFPTLALRIVWTNRRPTLEKTTQVLPSQPTPSGSQVLKHDSNGLPWQYTLIEDGNDTWLTSIWPHALADGPSMLRLLETMVAKLGGNPVPPVENFERIPSCQRSIASWVCRFLFEQSFHYSRASNDSSHAPGVAWLTIPTELASQILDRAMEGCGSFAAWLGAAAGIAFHEQQRSSRSNVMLNYPIQRNNLEAYGGFGFGAGSLLMPVRVDFPIQQVATKLSKRMKSMINEGWDINFDRFIGSNPKRHLRLAALHARGISTPMLNISWKGSGWQVGGPDGLRDVTCFALSFMVHVSGHIDRNGMSLSVASRQSPSARDHLLRSIVDKLTEGWPDLVISNKNVHSRRFEMH